MTTQLPASIRALPGSFEHIDVAMASDQSVLEIALNSPRGNVLSMAMMEEIAAALTTYRDVAPLKTVLLYARGKNFSYGASVAEHSRDQAPAMLNTFHDLVREIANYPIPIVAMVQGKCLGGAFEVVLCCHVVLAMRSAVFACPEIKLGVFPPVLAAIGHLRLGGALAERLLLTGAELHADPARQCGFVAHVDPDVDSKTTIDGDIGKAADPRQVALDWIAEHFGERSGYALRQATKAARYASGFRVQIEGALHAVEKQYIDEVLTSHDGNEGIDAFLQRRKPTWKHA